MRRSSKHPPISEIYGERLIAEGVVDQAWIDEQTKDFIAHLEDEFEAGANYAPNKADWFEGRWAGLGQPGEPVARGATSTPRSTTTQLRRSWPRC